VEKQIAFLARTLPAQQEEGPTRPTGRARQSAAGPDSGGARLLGPLNETAALPALPSAMPLLPPLPLLPLLPLLTQSISDTLDQAQRERGISALYVASGGRLFGQRLAAQWRTTDERRHRLLTLHEQHRARLSPETLERLARAEGQATKIADGRSAIQALATPAVQVIAAYSRMNAAYLAVIDSLTIRSVEVGSRPTALAWMALLHAKEKTGIERAQLASVFAVDRYLSGQQAAVSALIAASDSYLHLFAAAAPPAAEELLRRALRSETAEAVEAMEEVALSHEEGHFGIDPEAWFTTVSRKMDLFTDVESAVRASLVAP
jgi:methyl-accepting chemotaxis protein